MPVPDGLLWARGPLPLACSGRVAHYPWEVVTSARPITTRNVFHTRNAFISLLL